MKKITLFLLLLATTNVFSQEKEPFLKKKIEKLFANVPIEHLTTTLPFRSGEKVGFVDAKTLKIVVEPVDYIDVRSTFCPNLPSAIIYDEDGNYFFNISEKKEVELYSVNQFMNDIINDCILPFEEGEEKNNTIEISDNKGFEVDSNGNIIKISEKYVSETGYINASLFQHNKQHYAIAKDYSIQKEGIIDEKGNQLPHFNFTFHSITLNKYATDGEPWFFVKEKEDGEGYFLSLSGKKIQLKGLEWIHYEKKIIFGYAIASNNITEEYGILDLSTMEWVIPLQKKYFFAQILYTCKEKLDTDNIENRNKAVIYIENWSKERVFLMDFNLNEYFPKN